MHSFFSGVRPGLMLSICQENIKQEIANAKFVSVIADETTDISSTCQLVVVFRYVLNGLQPVERFWQFINPPGHNAASISQCIIQSLLESGVNKDKIISQSYDGANVMTSGKHGGVQTIIKEQYKYAYFVHCYAHQLNFIIAQCTSQNHQVRIFFSNLSDITNFF